MLSLIVRVGAEPVLLQWIAPPQPSDEPETALLLKATWLLPAIVIEASEYTAPPEFTAVFPENLIVPWLSER
ncbi:Uncharacterised protein [Chlamydia abortus]|nr:Uncharacterised protein [Chlamydia abortus]